MTPRALALLALCLLTASGSAVALRVPVGTGSDARPVARAVEEVARPRARPSPEDVHCAPDGTTCIARASYAADVCRAIEAAAGAEGLDPHFLARLLWQESLFDASAVSPAGAQGIAQFMPSTAEQEGLDDPFNPAEAIVASAAYLKELEGRFGNLGLAAAAYNAGEDRTLRWLASTAALPAETRAYVQAVTGQPAEAWRTGVPDGVDVRLDGDAPFGEACLARAEGREAPPPEPPALLPWGVVLAAQDSRAAAEAQMARVMDTHGALLRGERVDFATSRVPGQPRPRETAQVGRASREEAEQLCRTLRAARAACMVLRN